jgi:hypothetical protein
MSLVLNWETPPDLFSFSQMAFKTRVYRAFRTDTPDGNNTYSPEVLLTPSSTWGVYEDPEVNDPASVRYRVTYLGPCDTTIREISNCDIRVWRRPGNSCRINLCCTRPDSSPWIGRRIKFVNMPTESYVRDLYTNIDGQAMAILEWDWLMRLTMDGWDQALQFVVPRVQEIAVPNLTRFGSWIPLETRGLYA